MGKYSLALIMFCAAADPSLSGQTPADAAQTPTIRTTTREVVLDVVVRDKHHHAISDLRPDEIRVFEDGAPQKVNAFRNVQGVEQLKTEQALAKSAPSVSASASGPGKPSTTLRQINFVSVVFAQIAPLNLEFAREAVNDFLNSDRLPNTYVTIYRLDHVLHVVQPYTADKKALMSAVNAAAKGANGNRDLAISADAALGINASIQAQTANIIASPASTAATDQAAQDQLLNPLPVIAKDPLWGRNAASQDVSVDLNNALLAQAMLANGLRFAENLSNGMNAMDALRQLIRVQCSRAKSSSVPRRWFDSAHGWKGIVAEPVSQLRGSSIPITLAHLWFLYYLLAISLAALAIAMVRLPRSVAIIDWIVARPLRALAIAPLPAWACLVAAGKLQLDTPLGFARSAGDAVVRVVLRVGLVARIAARRARRARGRGADCTLAIAVVATAAATPALLDSRDGARPGLVATAICALGSWAWVMALVGGARRWLPDAPRVLDRCARDSLWIYITHLPLVVLAQVGAAALAAPGAIEYVAIAAIALGGSGLLARGLRAI